MNPNKIKRSGRTRKVFITITLLLSLLFGKPRLSFSGSSSSNLNNQAVHERVLRDQGGKVDSIRGGFNADSIKRSYRHIPDLFVGQGIQKVTSWSVAKHIHHSPEFGLNPNKYGMTQADLDSIARNGLVNHINQGGTKPSEEFVKDLQMVWKVFAEDKNSICLNNQKVMGKNCTVFKNMKTGHFIAFDSQTGESFTAYRLTEKQSIRHDQTNTIGQDYNHKN